MKMELVVVTVNVLCVSKEAAVAQAVFSHRAKPLLSCDNYVNTGSKYW